MAQITCPHCGGLSFALSTERLSGASFPLAVVRCASCDAPFGALQSEDPNATIRQEAMLLATSLGQIGSGLAKDLAEILRRLPTPSSP